LRDSKVTEILMKDSDGIEMLIERIKEHLQ